MNKFLIGATACAVILGSMAVTVFASPDTPNWGSEVTPGKCDKVGKPIVNVVQKITNTVDSGQGGNYWAFDNLTRQIQVWATSTTGEYCAVVQYEGEFDSQAGQISPGAGYILDGDEDGTFQGGYQATLSNATLKTTPLWKTKGFVGTTDYQCDISGTCPGAVNWIEQYFDSYSFGYDWWGWIYYAGKHGTWINSSDGNSGDIF